MATNSLSSRSVDVRSTKSRPIVGRTWEPSSGRAFSIVFGDLSRAWRDFEFGATLGTRLEPGVDQVVERGQAGPAGHRVERLCPAGRELVEIALGIGPTCALSGP
jgi:hypothetical protein